MRNLIFGVTFGLLAVVFSTPVPNVTQIPTKAEDDILHEAVTDGFLIELPALTTVSPQKNTTVSATQQPSSALPEKEVEGSALGETGDLFPHEDEHHATTMLSTSTVFLRGIDHSVAGSATTHSPQASFTSTSETNEAKPTATLDQTSSTTTHLTVPTFDSLGSDSGSGDGEIFDQHPTTTSRMTTTTKTETSTATSTTMAAPLDPKAPRRIGVPEVSGSGSGEEPIQMEVPSEPQVPQANMTDIRVIPLFNEPQTDIKPENKGHSTPGWIIIVGFIVGVAALIMLFVAIATRDKWNGPSKASQLETNTNSTNQQKEQEMETFLRNDQPKENGKASEYSVIPLDELPEKYSSH